MRRIVRRVLGTGAAVVAVIALAGAATATATASASAGTATADRWRFAYQGSVPGDVTSVAAISRDDAWAAGELHDAQGHSLWQSFVLHWNGRKWIRVAIPGAKNFMTPYVEASAASNVWVFGDDRAGVGTVFRWDGTRWHTMPGGPADAVVLSPADAWAADGYSCTPVKGAPPKCVSEILHWNGSAWQLSFPSGVFEGLAGTRAEGMWAVGIVGPQAASMQGAVAAYRLQGTRWIPVRMPHPAVTGQAAIGADSASDVWITAANGRGTADIVMHWNGVKWRTFTRPGPALDSGVLDAVPDGHGGVWVGLWHWTGRSWIDTSGSAPIGLALDQMVKVPGTSGSYWAASLVYSNLPEVPRIAVYGPLP